MADVIVEVDEHVQVIRISRPRVRNALNAAVARGIADAIDQAQSSDQIHVSVLTGDTDAFSSGADLRALSDGETAEIDGRGLCRIAYEPPAKPLIAAVEGWALGAGLELLLSCDLVVAGTTAQFGLPEVRLGLVAGGGGAMLLPRRVPPAVAFEILLIGDPISAERAAAIGLVNDVVPAGDALRRAVELAQLIARNAPLAVQAAKAIALQSAEWSRAEMWKLQAAVTAPVLGSLDAQEGGKAFLEGRAPVWRGR